MSEKRKHFILDLIEQDLSTKEIREKLTARQEKVNTQLERGVSSEKQAADAIGTIDIVNQVTIFKRGSRSDKKGRDLMVTLSQKKAHSLFKRELAIPHVFVQVKSSQIGISSFRNTYGSNEEEIGNNLAEKKLVVLNGNNEPKKIVDSFLEQIDFIDQYWQ
jgi:hypothetical protein